MSDYLDVSVVTTEPMEIMFFDVGRVANVCTSSCQFHNRLVKNFMRSFAEPLDINRRLD